MLIMSTYTLSSELSLVFVVSFINTLGSYKKYHIWDDIVAQMEVPNMYKTLISEIGIIGGSVLKISHL